MTGGDFCCLLNEGNKVKKGKSFKDQVEKYLKNVLGDLYFT